MFRGLGFGIIAGENYHHEHGNNFLPDTCGVHHWNDVCHGGQVDAVMKIEDLKCRSQSTTGVGMGERHNID